MDKKELEFILQEGEGLKIEFKEGTGGIDKEIVAFANARGGRIFLGITDKGIVKGIKITNKLKSQIQDLARNCDPSIKISLQEFENILIINVKEETDKPYKCSSGFYLRQGPNSQKMTVSEIREFFNKEGKILFDEQINKEFKFPEDFDKNKLSSFLEKAKISKVISSKDILKNIGVLNNKDEFRNAGVLFFCHSVELFIPHALVTCVLYKGKDKTFIIDKKDFTAEVFSNYEDVMKFLYKNLKIIYRIEGFGPRKEILEIPEDALKEAIINSIAHRDYNEKGARIQIDIFDDRVEISNPGGLIIKEEEFGKRSLSRNPLIFSLLQKLELVEQVGSGINRIKNAMRKTRLRKPDFEFGKFFSVTLFRPTSEDIGRLAGMKTTQKTTQKILALIKENPEITRNELANSLGISSDGVKYHLNNLKKEGILKHIGGRKGGHWVVLE